MHLPRLLLPLTAAAALLSPAAAFHVYLEPGAMKKCFTKDVPHETLVITHYRTHEHLGDSDIHHTPDTWSENGEITVQITVDDETHRVVNQRGKASGDVTFTSTTSGKHTICLEASFDEWFGSHRIRLSLDIQVGHHGVSPIENKDHKINDMAWQLREVRERVDAVKVEQAMQFERETQFRDTSERANARVVWWTLLQFGVLAAAAWWQLGHLKGFFVAKKLV